MLAFVTGRVLARVALVPVVALLLGFATCEDAAAQCGQITIRNETSHHSLSVSVDGRFLGIVGPRGSRSFTVLAGCHVFKAVDPQGRFAIRAISIAPRRPVLWRIGHCE